MKILICIPSNKPDLVFRFQNSFMLQNGLHKYFDIKICRNGDKWDQADEDWDNNLYQLRVGMIDYSYDYIMLADDDLQFEEDATDYMLDVVDILKNDRPGVLSLFRNRYPNVIIRNPHNCIMTTNRGLFIETKTLADILPLSINGACEDAVMGYYALESNPLHIVIGGAPITRSDSKHIEKDSESEVHDLETYINNARFYIRNRYDDPEWDVLTGEFPKGLER